MAASRSLLVAFFAIGTGACTAQAPASLHSRAAVPSTQATTLSGQHLSLPRDLAVPATIFIVGFGRHSQDATTAWEKSVRTQLAKPGIINFYDVAMLSEVPGFVRPMVLRLVRSKVPDVLKPNFLPLTEGEDAWKAAAGYSNDAPEAAYVLLADKSGQIRWSTHDPFSPTGFAELQRRAAQLGGS